MDGELSFHEQGCERKRPVSEDLEFQVNNNGYAHLYNAWEPDRANSVRAAFLVSFLAVEKRYSLSVDTDELDLDFDFNSAKYISCNYTSYQPNHLR